ncbi:FAD/NAD(P)-binding domain-containing protein [Astrocystis sublimbata]|nr:FAD/NAD(P)-binding domain-containing protein [Astrocystis sublimbata]
MPFRAIILGGGPAGLFTAQTLVAANIDFIVLERQPEIVRFRGALLVLWSPFVRVMDQLGLYQPAVQYSTRLTTKTNFTHSGEPLCSGPVYEAIEKELGYPTLGLSRGNLLRVLYDNLPERQTKVKTSAHVVKVETNNDGVRVHLADGSVVYGSMVIAADGVHSPTRELIQRLNNQIPTSPMVPAFLSLFGQTCRIRGDVAESHGPGTASQSIRLRESMYFTVLRRIREPIPANKRFTNVDMDRFVEEMSDITVFPGIKLKEVWPQREQGSAVLLPQEEGVAGKWYHGRIVLLGDAAHKMTSVNGQGALSGAMSAVTLCNYLRATLRETAKPSTEDLEATFARYEKSRKETVTGVVNQGHFLTRLITWTSQANEAHDRASSVVGNLANSAVNLFVPGFRKSPILDFLPFKSQRGDTPWEMEIEFQSAQSCEAIGH